jgi:hypothetical protein
MSHTIEADPIFAAIEKYQAACRVFDEGQGNGRLGRAATLAADIALRELVFMTATSEEGAIAQLACLAPKGATTTYVTQESARAGILSCLREGFRGYDQARAANKDHASMTRTTKRKRAVPQSVNLCPPYRRPLPLEMTPEGTDTKSRAEL